MKTVIKIDIQANQGHVGVTHLSLAFARFLRQNGYTNVVVDTAAHTTPEQNRIMENSLDSYLNLDIPKLKSTRIEVTPLRRRSNTPVKYERINAAIPQPTEEEKKQPGVAPAFEGSNEFVSSEPVELRLEVDGGFRQSGRSVLIALAADALKKAGFDDVTIQSPGSTAMSGSVYPQLLDNTRAVPESLEAARGKILKNKIVLIDRS